MKRKELDTADGYRMAQVLALLRQCLESTELERKIAELEAAIANRDNVTYLRKVIGK
jgi:hypothetical protein